AEALHDFRTSGPAPGTRKAPVKIETAEDVAVAGQVAAAEPTPGQREAGNYQKGHLAWNGLNISIETPKGGTRRAKDGSWEVPDMPAAYGYIKGTEGTDGDQLDIFIGDNPESLTIYGLEQQNPDTGKFDEHKLLGGFNSEEEARAAYVGSFSDGKGESRIRNITPYTIGQVKTLRAQGYFKKRKRGDPYAGIADVVEPSRTITLYRAMEPGEYEEWQRTGIIKRGDAERATENRKTAEFYATQRADGTRVIEFTANTEDLLEGRNNPGNYRIMRDIKTHEPGEAQAGPIAQEGSDATAQEAVETPAPGQDRPRGAGGLAQLFEDKAREKAGKQGTAAADSAAAAEDVATEEPSSVTPRMVELLLDAARRHAPIAQVLRKMQAGESFNEAARPLMMKLLPLLGDRAIFPSIPDGDTFAAAASKFEASADTTRTQEEIDQIRKDAGKPDASALKKPVTNILKKAGGVDPDSTLAGELRHMGITSSLAPGLFRKGGIGAADNFVASEHDIFANHGDETGYIPEATILAALRDEYFGSPWRTQGQKDTSEVASTADTEAAAREYATAKRAEAIEAIQSFGKAEMPGFDLSPEELDRAVELYQQGMALDIVYERIAFEWDQKQRHPEIQASIKQEWLPGYESDSTRTRKAGTGVSEGGPRQAGPGGEAHGVPDQGSQEAPAAGEAGGEAGITTEATPAGEQPVIPGEIGETEYSERFGDLIGMLEEDGYDVFLDGTEDFVRVAVEAYIESGDIGIGLDLLKNDLAEMGYPIKSAFPIEGETETLQDLIDRKASFEEIAAHPEIVEAQARMAAVPETSKVEGYGTDEYWAKREFVVARAAPRDGFTPFLHATGLEAFIPLFRRKVADAHAGGPVAKEKKAIIIVGTPAAGKTTLAKRLAKAHKAAIIDVDDVNQSFPEYQDGLGRHAVHLEGLHVAHDLERAAVAEGANFILPKSGFESRSISDRIKRLKERGYTVDVINVDVDQDEAARRMAKRFLETGRIVDPDYMRGSGARAKTSYNNLRAEGLADRYAEVESTGKWPWPVLRDGEALAGIEGYPGAEGVGEGGAAASGEDLRQPSESEADTADLDIPDFLIRDPAKRKAMGLPPLD
ncbi:MAG: zeta toxin family protein, partial [Methyloceanibacter sp.]